MKKLFLALFLAFASVAIVQRETFATMPEHVGFNAYTGNGSTTAFTYGFKIMDQAHIAVLVDGVTKTISTHYTVSGVSNSNGGTVTFVTAPATGTKVVLMRDSPVAQGTNYVANSAYSATTLMADLDRLAAVAQQLQEQISRAYAMVPGYSLTALPNQCSGTQKMIGFDATGAISCGTDLNTAAATANQWDQITAPTGNASLAMANNRSTFTWGAATGANAPWRLTDTASNTGTGALLQLDTASGSSLKPFQATAAGTANGVQMSTAGSLAAIGTGGIVATSVSQLTTKGDLLTHNGTSSARFPVCTNGLSIVADSTQTSGWKCGGEVLVVKTADELVNNNATVQNDDELFYAVEANSKYYFTAWLVAQTTSTTPDIKIEWGSPASATMYWGLDMGSTANGSWGSEPTTTTPTSLLSEVGGGGTSFATAGLNNNYGTGLIIRGILLTAGTAGTLQLKWAQNTATVENTKVLAGSVLAIRKQ